MSGDREARAVGAGEKIQVKGSDFTLRPITVQHLCDLQRGALDHYKRQYLSTFKEHAPEMFSAKVEEAAKWTVADLPQIDAFSVANVPLSEDLCGWLEKEYGDLPNHDRGKQALLLNALDTGRLDSERVKEMSGKSPIKGRVRYDEWWVTSVIDGMVQFVFTGLRSEHPNVTIKELEEWPLSKLAEASRVVEHLSSADLGNT